MATNQSTHTNSFASTGDEKVEAIFELEKARTPHTDSVPPAPNGGSVAWLQVVGAALAYANTWGLLNAFGVFQTFYTTQLLSNESASAISWIGTLQSCFIGVGALYAGPVFDNGNVRALLIAGSLMIILGMFLTSFCKTYWQIILSQGLLMGLGVGSLVIPAASIVASYFTSKRSTALGVMASGATLGGTLYPIIFSQLIDRIGFGWTVRLLAFLMIPQLIVTILSLKQRVRPEKVRAVYDKRAIRELDFIIYSIAILIGFAGTFVPYFYIQTYCSDLGIITGRLNSYLLPILNASGLIGRIGFGPLADFIGPMNSYIIASLACCALLFGWIGIHSTSGVLLFVILYGIFSSGLISLSNTVVAISLTRDIRDYPVRLTMICIPVGLGLLIGNPIAGAVLQEGWRALQGFSAACCVVSTLLCILARGLRTDWSIKAKF